MNQPIRIDPNHEAPFEGFPPTRQITDQNGDPVFIITPRTLSPFRAKLADLAAGAAVLAIAGGSLFYLDSQSITNETTIAALLAAPLLAYPLLKFTFAALFKARTKIILTPGTFRFKRWRWSKPYDRSLPHKFSLLEHDWAHREKERHDLAIRRAQADGEIISKKKFFSESFYLCFDLVGQRIDILCVYGRKPSLAILARIKAADEIMDAYARMGDGLALSPDQQWRSQPGDLPAGGEL